MRVSAPVCVCVCGVCVCVCGGGLGGLGLTGKGGEETGKTRLPQMAENHKINE
jgi:hypothetical protein